MSGAICINFFPFFFSLFLLIIASERQVEPGKNPWNSKERRQPDGKHYLLFHQVTERVWKGIILKETITICFAIWGFQRVTLTEEYSQSKEELFDKSKIYTHLGICLIFVDKGKSLGWHQQIQ